MTIGDDTTIGMSFEDLLCDKPKRYLFVDGIHPTARGHRVLARVAEDLLDDDDDDDEDDDDDDDHDD